MCEHFYQIINMQIKMFIKYSFKYVHIHISGCVQYNMFGEILIKFY